MGIKAVNLRWYGASILDILFAFTGRYGHFFERTGFTMLEHDGNYPGDDCLSEAHTAAGLCGVHTSDHGARDQLRVG